MNSIGKDAKNQHSNSRELARDYFTSFLDHHEQPHWYRHAIEDNDDAVLPYFGGSSAARSSAVCGVPTGAAHAAGPQAPLSKAHISPVEPLAQCLKGNHQSEESGYYLTKQGQNVVFMRESPEARQAKQKNSQDKSSRKQVGGGTRERITEFSHASRRLLGRRMNSIDFDTILSPGSPFKVLTLLLTYGEDFPDPRATKPHLDAFIKALRRRYPEFFGSWKLEPQKRGAPHYHLIGVFLDRTKYVLGEGGEPEEVSYLLDDVRTWMCFTWNRIVRGGKAHYYFHKEFHIRDGERRHCVEEVNSVRRISRYVTKYVGKPASCDGWDYTGRWWGLVNRRGLVKFVRGRYWQLNKSQFYKLRRCFRRMAPKAIRRRVLRGPDTGWSFDRGDESPHWRRPDGRLIDVLNYRHSVASALAKFFGASSPGEVVGFF